MKPAPLTVLALAGLSLPVRGRGLKQSLASKLPPVAGRSPCGGAD